MARSERELRNNSAFDGNAARKIAVREVKKQEKRNNIVRLNEKQLRKARRANVNPLKMVMSVAMVGIAFTLMLSIIYGQVQLTELTEKVNTATTTLGELESVEVQLQMKASANQNLEELMAVAETELGLEKIKSSQVTYLNLAQEDKAYVLQQQDRGFFASIWNTFLSWLS